MNFRERILCVRVLMGLVDYFRFCGLFLGFTNVFNGLVRLDREWSGVRSFTIWRLVGKRRENFAFGVYMVLHEDIMVQG